MVLLVVLEKLYPKERDDLSVISYLMEAWAEAVRLEEPESMLRTVLEIVEVVVSILVENPSFEFFDIDADAFSLNLSKNPFPALKEKL